MSILRSNFASSTLFDVSKNEVPIWHTAANSTKTRQSSGMAVQNLFDDRKGYYLFLDWDETEYKLKYINKDKCKSGTRLPARSSLG